MKVADLVRAMEALAPPSLAAPWDNVGLLVGDPEAAIARVLLTIDCTDAVFAEAASLGAGAIVSYHPPILRPQRRFTAESVAFRAARAGIAVYSPHTALDAAPGGTNDVLADVVGMSARVPLRPSQPGEPDLKLVTFVPGEHVEAVSAAIFAAGAGHIGRYSSCSFRGAGMGTFFCEQGAQPVVGRAGRLEQAAEVRLETVVPARDADRVVQALRAAHPYEEPAFDLVRLVAPPSRVGLGLVGEVERTSVVSLASRVKSALGASHALAAGPTHREVTRVAVCAGSAGELAGDAAAAGAELLVTGELRHHDALAAVAAGMNVLCTLHSVSERGALPSLAKNLEGRLPGLVLSLSSADVEPFAFV